MLESAVGEGRQFCCCLVGRPEEEKPWSRRWCHSSLPAAPHLPPPPLLFPELLPPTTHPLKFTCLQLILADAHEDGGWPSLDLGRQPQQSRPPEPASSPRTWGHRAGSRRPPPWPQWGPLLASPALPLLEPSLQLLPRFSPGFQLPVLEHNLCLPPSHTSVLSIFLP